MATVTTSTTPWLEIVKEQDPNDDLSDPPIVYYFSNGRTFEDSGPASGVYA